MLVDRKYILPKLPDYETFIDKFCFDYDDAVPINNLTFTTHGLDRLLVYFTDEETIGIKQILKLYDLMNEKDIVHCVFVYPGSLTFTAKKFLHSKKEIRVETFCEDELIVNITKHMFSPTFHVLTELEKKEITSKFNGQYPKLLATDPIAKYFGLRKNDIIQIDRRSETVGIYTTFRIVC